MTTDIVEIGRCDFADPSCDELGGLRCPNMGRALTLKDSLGFLVKRYLCRKHSDWIEAPKPEVPVLSLLSSASAEDLVQLGAFFDHIKGPS